MLDVYATELIAKEPPVKVICIPSLNECALNVTTPGLATEILETAADFVLDIDWTKPKAPDVPPVTFSPLEKAGAVFTFKCVNISTSNKKCL